MSLKPSWILFLFSFGLTLIVGWDLSLADHHEHGDKSWYHKIFDWDDDDESKKYRKRNRNRYRDRDHHGGHLKPVSNATYRDNCGACHFAYQPELLPSASWMKILGQLDDHFGEAIELDPEEMRIISDYLKSNAAEKSSAKRAVKIMRSLGNHVPMRITDIPYIREKHHELNPIVFERESIGSLSNCVACHTTAEEGIYEDDNVRIPK